MTVNCEPMMTGMLVESIQVVEGVKLIADCNLNPIAVAGQEKTRPFPFCLEFRETGIKSPEPRSATVVLYLAAMAVTPPCAVTGKVVWPKSFIPHVTTVPFVFKATV